MLTLSVSLYRLCPCVLYVYWIGHGKKYGDRGVTGQ